MSSRSLNLPSLVAPVLMAFVALAVVFICMTQKTMISAAVLGALLMVPVMAYARQPRLLLVWGMMLSMTTVFGKYFKSIMHQGGEVAFRIEVSDVFLILLGAWWLRDMIRAKNWSIRVPSVAWMWIGLIALGVLSIGIHRYRVLAAMEVQRMFKLLLLFLLIVNQVQRRKQFAHIVAALMVGVLLQASFGLLQYFFDAEFGLGKLGESDVYQVDVGGQFRKRLGGMLGHPNLMAGYLTLVLPLGTAMLFAPFPKRIKFFLAGTMALGVAALLLTLSRNGWAACGLAISFLILLSMLHAGIRRRTALLRVAMILAFVLAGLAVSKTVVERILKSDPNAVSSRWELNKIAFKMIADHPTLGVGKNAASYYITTIPKYRPEQLESTDPDAVPTIHNSYLLLWTEQGTVGFTIFVVMLVTVFRYGVKNLALRDDRMFALNIGLLSGVLGTMAHMMFDWVFWWNGITRIFFLFSAMIMAVHYWRMRVEVGRGAVRSAPRLPKTEEGA